MPNYEYTCLDCGSVTIESHRWESRPETITCACGGNGEYRVAMPNVVGKASYLDGTKRFQDLKEANKLTREAANSRPEQKKEIAQEIRKMGVRLEK